MESNDSASTCLIEKPQTVLYDSLVTARRKRREIRMLRKLTGTPTSIKGLNSIQQGVSTKRAGLRPLYAGCNSLQLFDDSFNDEEVCQLGHLMPRTTSDEENYSKLLASGLVRSRSFPPEGWQTSKYILQISRIGKCLNKCALSRGVSGDARMCDSCNANPVCLEDVPATSVQQVKPASDCPLQQVNTHSEDCRVPSVCGDAESCRDVTNPSQVKQADVDMDIQEPHTTSTMAPEAVTNGLFLAGKTALLQSVEGNLSNPCQEGSLEVKQARPVNCPPSGKVLICGRRREMEDTAVIFPSFSQIPRQNVSAGRHSDSLSDLHFYGVYDGHGGAQASKYCAERLHHVLAEEIASFSISEERSGAMEWKSAMQACFSKVDKEVGGVCPYGACDDVDSSAGCCSGTIAPENVGTTAVVAVVSSSRIVLGNCGDSRAVLSRGGKAIPLSQDHKPERADETSRIEAAGGRVIAWKGYRVKALLALSRAIGDRYLKRYVISEPDVVCLDRTEEDECLILASDGLWDVIDNDTACDVVRRCLASARGRERRLTSRGEDLASATAAATLVKLACGKGSQDNITVVVVDLSFQQQ